MLGSPRRGTEYAGNAMALGNNTPSKTMEKHRKKQKSLKGKHCLLGRFPDQRVPSGPFKSLLFPGNNVAESHDPVSSCSTHSIE